MIYGHFLRVKNSWFQGARAESTSSLSGAGKWIRRTCAIFKPMIDMIMIDIQAQKSVRIIMDGSITIDNYNVQKLRNLTPPEKTNMQKKNIFSFPFYKIWPPKWLQKEKNHFLLQKWPKMAIFDPKSSNMTPQIKPLRGGKNFIKFLLSLLLQFDFTTKNS